MKDKGFAFVVCCLLFVLTFAGNSMHDTRYTIHDTRFSMLDIGYRIPDAGYLTELTVPTSNILPIAIGTILQHPPDSYRDHSPTIRNHKSEIRNSSDSGFTLIKTIPIEAKDIQTDRLGNLYIVSKTNQLYKYGPTGKLLSTLNYKYLGNITHVDATNPMEIYVFYKELNLVVFLDNNLAYRGEMKLGDVGIGQAAAICRSFDNGIWIFDLGDLQLKKMDKNGENLQTTGNIRQYISQPSAVLFLYDNNDKVFVNDSANGILMFNIFGTYAKTIPIKGCTEIKVINDEIYYWQLLQLKKYRLKSFDTQVFALPEALDIKDISVEKDRVYLLKSTEVSIYGF